MEAGAKGMTASCVDIGSSPVANPSSKYFRQASFVATTAFLHAIHRAIAVSFDVVEHQQQYAQREHLSIGQAAVCSKDQATRSSSGSFATLAAMRRASSRVSSLLAIDEGQCLPAAVADDETRSRLLDGPRRWEAASLYARSLRTHQRARLAFLISSTKAVPGLFESVGFPAGSE